MTLNDPPRKAFRLSMLIYDSRYRATTIQIVVLIAALTLFGWLVNNTLQNLETLGKTLGFGFLGQVAGYDINQRLVDYTNQDTHLRAAFVGLLNTLLVAVMGVVTATVLGVIIGVLRLSKNWIVARLMTVYVEMFRNVPVLLWIILANAIIIELLPMPRAFRGENPEATLSLFGTTAFTNRGFYPPAPAFSNSLGSWHLFGDHALRFDVNLNALAIIVLLALSLWISNRIKRWATRVQAATGNRPTTWHMRWAVSVLPTLILLIALGFHLVPPELKGFNFKGGVFMRTSLIALWLALSLYTAAFIAEIVRAGILAVSKGQTEAAAALGLRPRRIMSLVILPQALRVIIPPLISQFLNLTKNSSLAIAVGYMDITGTLTGVTLNQTGRELEAVLLTMAIYLVISLSISAVMNVYNNAVKLQER